MFFILLSPDYHRCLLMEASVVQGGYIHVFAKRFNLLFEMWQEA